MQLAALSAWLTGPQNSADRFHQHQAANNAQKHHIRQLNHKVNLANFLQQRKEEHA